MAGLENAVGSGGDARIWVEVPGWQQRNWGLGVGLGCGDRLRGTLRGSWSDPRIWVGIFVGLRGLWDCGIMGSLDCGIMGNGIMGEWD